MNEWQERQGKPPQGGVEHTAAWIICLIGGVVGLWFLFRYAIGILLPFGLAYLLSRCIRPLVTLAVGKSRLPRSVAAGVLVVLFVGGLCLLLTLGVRRAVGELEGLVTHLSSGEDGFGAILAEVQDWLHSTSDHLPFLERFADTPGFEDFCDRLDSTVQAAADEALASLGRWASGAVMGMVTGIPSAVLFLTILFLSCFYFSADNGRIGRALGWVARRVCPSMGKGQLPLLRAQGQRIIGQCLRAYLILAAITFVEAFIGLSLIRMPYAFLMAWVVALVDILPLFGAGAVILPWAVVQFLTGATGQGIGLLVLWGIMSVIRQVIEPRLVSAGLGIHPLLSLLAMYGGWRLFGLTGMLLVPVLVTVAMQLTKKVDS